MGALLAGLASQVLSTTAGHCSDTGRVRSLINPSTPAAGSALLSQQSGGRNIWFPSQQEPWEAPTLARDT